MLRRLVLLVAFSGFAWGHDFWLKPQGQKAVLYYGHGSEESEYDARTIKKTAALNAKGDPIKLTQTSDGKHVVLAGEGEVAQLALEIDSGFWVKTVAGWKNESKRVASNALLSEWSLYYSKLVLNPQASLHRTFGQQLELVPVALTSENIKVRLLLHGRALPQVKLYDEHKKVADTDAAGEATLSYHEAMVLSASYREPLQANPDADRLNLHAVLSLPARAAEGR